MNGLLIGCPVYDRAWILEEWFDRTERWAKNVDIRYVFALTPGTDETAELIARRAPGSTVIEVTEGTHGTNRDWNRSERIRTMADTRNRLLKWVRHLMRVGPFEAFLSLDSDVLLPDWDQGAVLIENLRTKDAVSPLVYLGRGSITNVFLSHQGGYRRVRTADSQGTAAVLCAAVLMTRDLAMDERVQYAFSPRGEDFGWSENARKAGYRLGYDFSVKCKHCMEPEHLLEVDRRIGW